jgi:hypothetical protein
LDNYANRLRQQFLAEVDRAKAAASVNGTSMEPNSSVEVIDVDATYRRAPINRLRGVEEFWTCMQSDGMWWWRLAQMLEDFAPSAQGVADQFQWAMQLVPQALNELLGEGRWTGESREYKAARSGGSSQLVPVRAEEKHPPMMSPPSDLASTVGEALTIARLPSISTCSSAP